MTAESIILAVRKIDHIFTKKRYKGVKKMVQSRTHNCNELRLSDAGAKVTLVGWYENIRKVSKNLGFLSHFTYSLFATRNILLIPRLINQILP